MSVVDFALAPTSTCSKHVRGGHPWTHEISSEWMGRDYETTRDVDIDTEHRVDGPWEAFFRLSFGNTIREFTILYRIFVR